MNDVRKRLIHLHHCEGVGWKTIYKLLKIDSTLTFLYNQSISQLSSILKISNEHVEKILRNLDKIQIDDQLQSYENHDIKIITIIDKEYPSILKHIYEPPWVLYMKGKTDLLYSRRMMAVVGSRQPTNYGILCTNYFVSELTKKGFTIVSGLAKGIDSQAHVSAIQSNGRTIAVLGSGFSHIYPKEHKALAERIAKSHLLVTEYPPFTPPKKGHFPARNRIISGLSQAVLVIEAKKRSGSLITAQLALNEGREVFSVPGPIFEENSKGTNQLIQDGAKLVYSINDILEEIQVAERSQLNLFLIKFKI